MKEEVIKVSDEDEDEAESQTGTEAGSDEETETGTHRFSWTSSYGFILYHINSTVVTISLCETTRC